MFNLILNDMKAVKNLIKNTILLCLGCFMGCLAMSMSYENPVVERCNLDHSKDYEVACILNDICHMAMDYEAEFRKQGDDCGLYQGFEELYYDVIQNLDCYGIDEVNYKDFEDYCWAYWPAVVYLIKIC